MRLARLLSAFERAYRLKEAKELLRKDWRKLNESLTPSTGFCYIAAEALFHLLGKTGLKVMYASYVEDGFPCTHWWLVKGKQIIDPTKSQYGGEEPPYRLGKGIGFLTTKISKRAAKLTEIVLKELK